MQCSISGDRIRAEFSKFRGAELSRDPKQPTGQKFQYTEILILLKVFIIYNWSDFCLLAFGLVQSFEERGATLVIGSEYCTKNPYFRSFLLMTNANILRDVTH